MIEVKESIIEEILNKAIERATIRNTGQLVSITNEIDEINPVYFFETAKKLKKDRIFWSSVADDFYLVGIGSAIHINADGTSFLATEEQWQNILDDAIIYNPYETLGTGLILMGGMSFDPKKKRSPLWENYKQSQFIVPEYMLTKREHNYYFTMTLTVNKYDKPAIIAEQLNRSKAELLTAVQELPARSHVIQKNEIDPQQWLSSVQKAIDTMKKKDAEKIVLAREMRLKFNKRAEISPMLEKLIQLQANSYVFAFEQNGDCFIGATPERLIRIEDDQLLSTCIAGTAPRGQTNEEDEHIAQALFTDAKNRDEHDYVVKMIKNSIQNYCTNIEIPKEPFVYPFKNLHHLYTPVNATLKAGHSILDIVKQLHPTPALGGVPREKSLDFIREFELLDRGWYGAPIGWFDNNDNGEFAVAIRSGLIQDDEASLFAGCGVMKDSDPHEEYEETNIKFLPMLSVMED